MSHPSGMEASRLRPSPDGRGSDGDRSPEGHRRRPGRRFPATLRPALRRGSLLLAATLGLTGCGELSRAFFRASDPPGGTEGRTVADLPEGVLEIVATGLDAPWALAFLPDGGLLVTERGGRLVHLPPRAPGSPPFDRADLVAHTIPGVVSAGEGGLMGIALDPDFEESDRVYLVHTAEGAAGLENRLVRLRRPLPGTEADPEILLDGIPGGRFHNGGRLAFGPDGFLYVTTGDAGSEVDARDPERLAGKILRLTREGGVPPDNPFGSAVWSLGHRNPQGLAWDPEGTLWSTEHGRSGLRTGLDELNQVRPGADYGWPEGEGDSVPPGTVGPVLHSGPDYTWAPAGIAWWEGALYFGGLRGEALYEVRNPGEGVAAPVAHFAREFGRIREVQVGPDGALYLLTSNRDGRGSAREGDDRILRLAPGALR